MQEFKSLPLQINKSTLKESSDSYKKEDFARLVDILKRASIRVSWHQLRELQSILHNAQVRRFRGKRKTPKYGTLNKGFTDSELQQFFSVIDSDKFRLLFSYQAQLGLRVAEATRLNLLQINFKSRELTLKTDKARVVNSLLIPLQLFSQTIAYVKTNTTAIQKSSGYLFYKEDTGKDGLYLDMNYVRNRFRKYIVKAGLDVTYDISDESIMARTPRKLHRLTTHSLRHYAITRFARNNNGNIFLASKFARHTNPNTTLVYINENRKQLFEGIDNAFSMDEIENLKQRLDK